MKLFLVVILLIFTLIQCSLVSPDVFYSRELVHAYISEFEIDDPFTFGSDSFKVAGAHFQVDGETGVIYDVHYKVYGSVWFCGDGSQSAVDISSDRVFIADTIHISSKTIFIGVGVKNLSVGCNVNAPLPGQQRFAGKVGVRLIYRDNKGERQISKSESYDKSEIWCH